jgi:PHP family Zn ribbon phosphoesterase
MEPKKHPHVSHKVGEYPLYGKHDVLEALHLAEHAQEDAYFHKVNQALLAALRQQDTAKLEQALRQYVQMRCPRCGEPLQETTYQHIGGQECPSCGGIWLDKGTLEKLGESKEGNWLERMFEAFLRADM